MYQNICLPCLSLNPPLVLFFKLVVFQIDHVLALPENNIEKICRDVMVVNLPCHHANILEMIVHECKLDPGYLTKPLIKK